MLNFIWLGFFLLAALAALWQFLVLGQQGIFTALVNESFAMARLSVDIAIGMIGLLCFWLGLLKIADASGITGTLSRLFTPLFARVLPEVPRGHPAIGSMAMNCAANMLGLDNAATPIGLRAMQELQTLNHNEQVASRAQMLFMVLNTASVTLFPVMVMMYRQQAGASDPAAVFLPILLATMCGTIAGLLSISLWLRLPIWDRVVGLYLLAALAVVGALLLPMLWLPRSALADYSSTLGSGLLLLAIISILGFGALRKVPVFERFIDGAKEGFQLAVTLIPYLVAMLVAIGLLRASGAMDLLLDAVRAAVIGFGGDTAFVDALPTGLMKMLSGSGARAMMLETMHEFGADSFPAMAASVMQGSSETTFYVLAVYGGAVGLKRVGAALPCALIADVVGITAAILISYWFFVI